MPLIPNPVTTAKVGWQVVAWFRRFARRDHSTVYRGLFTKAQGGRAEIAIVVACAPRKALRRPRLVHPQKALSFLNAVVDGGFEMPPFQSRNGCIGFRVLEDDATGSWDPLRAGLVWSNGLCELLVRANTWIDEDDRLVVDLVSAMKPVYDLAAAVAVGSYCRLFGWRTRSKRLDWFVFLTNYRADEERGQRYWDDLAFPGRRPRVRAIDHYGAAPNLGLGALRLRGKRQRASPAEIVRTALEDLLRESGWLEGNDEAISDVLTTLPSGADATKSTGALSA